tara:strand:- start:34 stop:678 length:645 start_codon:yes stop_codon:yes gene_type:complete
MYTSCIHDFSKILEDVSLTLEYERRSDEFALYFEKELQKFKSPEDVLWALQQRAKHQKSKNLVIMDPRTYNNPQFAENIDIICKSRHLTKRQNPLQKLYSHKTPGSVKDLLYECCRQIEKEKKYICNPSLTFLCEIMALTSQEATALCKYCYKAFMSPDCIENILRSITFCPIELKHMLHLMAKPCYLEGEGIFANVFEAARVMYIYGSRTSIV